MLERNMALKALISFFCFLFLISSFHQQVFAKRTSKPIVLQFQVSHTRNTDQTSLIFRNKKVELVTNVSQISNQENKNIPIRLGHFHSPLNERLKLLKRKIQVYEKLLVKRGKGIDLSKVTKATDINDFDTDPHAPIIRLSMNGQSIEVRKSNPYFNSLRNILIDAQEQKWSCLSCAKYTKKGETIVRILKKKDRKPASISFSRENLQCLNLNQKRWECLDHQFGLFEIE